MRLLDDDAALLRRLVDQGAHEGFIAGVRQALEVAALGAPRALCLRQAAMWIRAELEATGALLPLTPEQRAPALRVIAELSAALGEPADDARYLVERQGGGVRVRVVPNGTSATWPSPFFSARRTTRDVLSRVQLEQSEERSEV